MLISSDSTNNGAYGLLTSTYKRGFTVLVATGLALNFFLLWSDWRELQQGYADFTIFYSAAGIVRSGRGADLYSEQAQWQAQLASAPGVNIRHGALPYNHPPFEALLFVPFTLLPYFSAYLEWNMLNAVMLAVVIWLVRRRSEQLRRVRWALPLLIALSFFPVFMCLFQGQDVILLLLVMTSAYALLKDGSDFEGGIALGLGLFRPQLVLPLALLVLCMRRTRRFAGGFVLSSVAVAALSIAVVGWHSFITYPSYVWRIERALGNGAIVPANMPNLRGLSSFLHEGSLSAFIVTGLSSIVLFTYAAQVLRSCERGLTLELSFAIAILATLLVSYHLLIYDLALLFLPILFVYEECIGFSNGPLAAIKRWAVIGPIAFMFCTPLLMLLWLSAGKFNLVALVLLVWFWGLVRASPRPAAQRNEMLAAQN
ncbi:MAG TPA: glycosyltransferase family 87 protein [Candidatus Angelobacter sp.]|nr:glycosyltransferase family 87 protein [Candidatus Angelobacter sp.]